MALDIRVYPIAASRSLKPRCTVLYRRVSTGGKRRKDFRELTKTGVLDSVIPRIRKRGPLTRAGVGIFKVAKLMPSSDARFHPRGRVSCIVRELPGG